MNLQNFANEFKRIIAANGNERIKSQINRAANGTQPAGNNDTFYSAAYNYRSGDSKIIDGWYDWVLTNNGGGSGQRARGAAAVNLSQGGPSTEANSALLGATMNGANVGNATRDDWQDVGNDAGINNQYNSAEAGNVCAKITLKGHDWSGVTRNNNTMQIAANDIFGNNGGNPLTGSRAIEGFDNYTAWHNEFVNQLNGLPNANKIRTTITPEQSWSWLFLLHEMRSHATAAGNQRGVDVTGPEANGGAANETWQVANLSIENALIKFVRVHNAGWDAEFLARNGNNIQIPAAKSPNNANILGTYAIASSNSGAATGAAITFLSGSVYRLFRDQCQVHINANIGALVGTDRHAEIHSNAAITKNHVEKAKEWWELKERLSQATGQGATANVRINPVTGAAVNQRENWTRGGYTEQQKLQVLMWIFANGWEADDISLSAGNDIEIKTDKSPDNSYLVGSQALIDPTQSKVELAANQARTHDDQGNTWSTSKNPVINATNANRVFGTPGNINSDLEVAGNPKETIKRIIETQKILRKVQEVNQLNTYDYNLEGDLEHAKNSPANSTDRSAYQAANRINSCVDRAIQRLNSLYRKEQKQKPDKGEDNSNNSNNSNNSKANEALENRGREDAKKILESIDSQAKPLLSLTPTGDKKKDEENIAKIEVQIKEYEKFSNNTDTTSYHGQISHVWQTSTTSREQYEKLKDTLKVLKGEKPAEEKKPETDTGGDKTGGDKTGGDKTGGDKTGGDKTGGENGESKKPATTAESVRDSIHKEMEKHKYKENKLNKIWKKLENEYPELKNQKNLTLEAAIELVKKTDSNKLSAFQSAVIKEIEGLPTQSSGFSGHMKNNWGWYLGAFALLGLGAGAYFYFTKKSKQTEETEDSEE